MYQAQNAPSDVVAGKGQLSFYLDLSNSQIINQYVNVSAVRFRSNSSQVTDRVLGELNGKNVNMIVLTVYNAKPIEESFGMTDEDEGMITNSVAVPSNNSRLSFQQSNNLLSVVKFLPPVLQYRK
ncbi:hypothetical protein HY085_02115 [Candidatus Gottesmanbacteria bacterium]|nr:hypothetical protein [Candidatus Gottesmanbacteria bacterium]